MSSTSSSSQLISQQIRYGQKEIHLPFGEKIDSDTEQNEVVLDWTETSFSSNNFPTTTLMIRVADDEGWYLEIPQNIKNLTVESGDYNSDNKIDLKINSTLFQSALVIYSGSFAEYPDPQTQWAGLTIDYIAE